MILRIRGSPAGSGLTIRQRLPDSYTAEDGVPVAGARENIPTQGRFPEINQKSTSAGEQWRPLELPGVGQVLEGLWRERVGNEGHGVDPAVERHELDPLPHLDLQMRRDDVFHVPASG